MNNFQRHIYRTINEEATMGLEMGSISSTSQALSAGACDLILDSVCYISTSINGVITSGDIVYQDIAGTNPILGGDTYYRISLMSTYVVLISDGGVMNVFNICA